VKPGDHNRHAIDSVARTTGECILGSRTAVENAPLRFKTRHVIGHKGWSVGDCLLPTRFKSEIAVRERLGGGTVANMAYRGGG
jgi:hypothetical protein